jgi:hypothetical protein
MRIELGQCSDVINNSIRDDELSISLELTEKEITITPSETCSTKQFDTECNFFLKFRILFLIKHKTLFFKQVP